MPRGYSYFRSDDGEIKIWTVGRSVSELTFVAHNSDIKSLSWHPSKSLICSSSRDTTIKLWDPKGGRCVRYASFYRLNTYSHHSPLLFPLLLAQLWPIRSKWIVVNGIRTEIGWPHAPRMEWWEFTTFGQWKLWRNGEATTVRSVAFQQCFLISVYFIISIQNEGLSTKLAPNSWEFAFIWRI